MALALLRNETELALGTKRVKSGWMVTVFEEKPGGRRHRGRAKLRRMDCKEKDLRSLGVKGWRKKMERRDEWANFIKVLILVLESSVGKSISTES